MIEREAFTLYPRRLPSGNVVYYYQVYDESGKRKPYSTGKSDRKDAYRYCLDLLKDGKLLKHPEKSFAAFASPFFLYDSCPYIRGRLLRGGHYSRTYAENQRAYLLKSILPEFGTLELKAIGVKEIESWLFKLKEQGLRNVSINHRLKTLRVILKEAFRQGELPVDPTDKVRPFMSDSREKGILSLDEVRVLFKKGSRERIWKGSTLHYALNLTAALTGMRLGELLCLKRTDIHPAYIDVCHSWDRRYGEKGTKTGKNRAVPIPESLYSLLHSMPENPASAYLFSYPGNPAPLDHRPVLSRLYTALTRIGISEEERVSRNLTFHSWRHFFNTRLRLSNVPDTITRKLTGHRSEQMSEHYTHHLVESMQMVVPIQKELIDE